MCGRFALNADAQLIQQTFNLDTVPAELSPRFNVAPSQPVPVITNAHPKTLEMFRWGLVPSWAKDLAVGNKMINARVETAPEKPSFREAFKKRRCLIPATGFYEWAQSDKTPMYIHLKDQEIFAFAGLWESWKSPQGETVFSTTILTGEPNELLSQFHHRMAIILRPEDYATWLNPEPMSSADLMPLLLQPYPADAMEAYEISKLVNSPANDTPQIIEPVGYSSQPGLL